MDEKDLDILYRPKIEIERNYYSDGVIPHEEKVSNVPEEIIKQQEEIDSEIPSEIEKAIDTQYKTAEKLLRIRKITEILPPKTKKVTDDLIDSLLIIIGTEIPKLEDIKEQDDKKPDEEKYDIPEETVSTPETVPDKVQTPTDDVDEDTDEWPTMTSSGFIFNVVKNKDSWDLAQEQYLLDSTKIKEMFADEYNDILQSYAYQLVSAMGEVGIDNVEALNYNYEGETVSGITDNYQHLNDIIARNQLTLNEYQDLFKKTHDSYTTDAVFTAFDVVSQERVRYLKEKYKDEAVSGYIELYDKKFLGDCREEYEKRYKAARADVYKLLHSAAAISEKILNKQLDLVLSKCSLLAKNVDIFAQKEYESEVFSNTTVASQKTSDSNNTSKTNNQATETKKTDTKSNTQQTTSSDSKNTVTKVQNKTSEASSGSVNKTNDIVGNVLNGLTKKVTAVAKK